jgi:hypothetical protein
MGRISTHLVANRAHRLWSFIGISFSRFIFICCFVPSFPLPLFLFFLSQDTLFSLPHWHPVTNSSFCPRHLTVSWGHTYLHAPQPIYSIGVTKMFAFQNIQNISINSWKISVKNSQQRGRTTSRLKNQYLSSLQLPDTVKQERTSFKRCSTPRLINQKIVNWYLALPTLEISFVRHLTHFTILHNSRLHTVACRPVAK